MKDTAYHMLGNPDENNLVFTESSIMNSDEQSIELIKSHIVETYLNGAFNARNVTAMRRGFHEDFAIFSAEGDALGKFPIGAWTAKLEQSLADGYDADDPKNRWHHEFAIVDVTGTAAFVKLHLFNEGVHVYTDYISLLRFDRGWRVAAKIYHQHNERTNW